MTYDVESLIFSLSAFLGVLSIINKLLLLREKAWGWATGMAIGVLSSIFFYAIGLTILAVAELGFFAVMLYGLMARRKTSGVIELAMNVALTIITVGLAWGLFVGMLTFYQVVSSLSFIWGGYALAVKRKGLGWTLLLVAHIATAVASLLAGQPLFSGLQVVSALVCIYALTGGPPDPTSKVERGSL